LTVSQPGVQYFFPEKNRADQPHNKTSSEAVRPSRRNRSIVSTV
jgi:hypothetical protein